MASVSCFIPVTASTAHVHHDLISLEEDVLSTQDHADLQSMYETRGMTSATLNRLGWGALYTSNVVEVVLGAASISPTVQSWLVPLLVTALGPLGVTAVNLPWVAMGIMAAGAILSLISFAAAEVLEGEAGQRRKTHESLRDLKQNPIHLEQLKSIRDAIENACQNIETKSKIFLYLGGLFILTSGLAGLILGFTALNLPEVGIEVVAAGEILGWSSLMASDVLDSDAETFRSLHRRACNIYDIKKKALNTTLSQLLPLFPGTGKKDFENSIIMANVKKVFEDNENLRIPIEDFSLLWNDFHSYVKAGWIYCLYRISKKAPDTPQVWEDIKHALQYLYAPLVPSKDKITYKINITHVLLSGIIQYNLKKKSRDLFKPFLKRLDFLKKYHGNPHISNAKWVEAIEKLCKASDDQLAAGAP